MMNVNMPASFVLHDRRKSGQAVLVPVDNISLARPARWGDGTCVWLKHGPISYIIVTESVTDLARMTNTLAGQQ